MTTTVVHCKRAKHDVYIGRPSIWGNPFIVGKDGTREEVIAKYAAWVVTQPQLMAQVGSLHGKTLGCWCKGTGGAGVDVPCHGDVLRELAAQEVSHAD